MQSDQPDESANILINPSLSVIIAERLFQKHEPMIAKEDWVAVNTALMKDIGEEKWLKRLLAALETTASLDELEDATLNPYAVISFAPQSYDKPSHLMDNKNWIDANIMIIRKIGQNAWLWRLLDVMETDKLTG